MDESEEIEETEETEEIEDELEQSLNRVINFIDESTPRFQKIEDEIASINVRFDEIRGEVDVKIGKVRTEVEEKHQTVMTRLDEINNKIEELIKLEGQHKQELEEKITEESAAQTKAREELSTKRKEEVDELISETNRTIQALAKNLGAAKLDVEEKHEAVSSSLTEINTRIDELQQMDSSLEERITQNSERLDANDQKWEKRNTEFEERKNEIDNINNELFQFANALKESIVDTNKVLQTTKEDLQSQVTTGIERTEVLNKGVQSLQEAFSEFTEVIDSQSQSYHSLHNELKALESHVEERQTELLQSTQRIVQGIAGDLRTEIILANKTAREMLEEYRKEIHGTYYSITEGQRQEEEIRGLEKEFIAKAERIRDDLTNSLKKNLDTIEQRTQKSIETVRTYKAELDDYKDDITVFIERRVAEKMDWIYDILSRTAQKTEELKHEIRNVQIAPAQRASIVVPSLEKVEYPDKTTEEVTPPSEPEGAPSDEEASVSPEEEPSDEE
ncbi:MAG: hypothetical protein ACFFC7_28205 [Candidatus Hermodarchaeota archaeon]